MLVSRAPRDLTAQQKTQASEKFGILHISIHDTEDNLNLQNMEIEVLLVLLSVS